MNDRRRSNGRGGAISPRHRAAGQQDPPHLLALKRVSMAGATAFLAINLWTGAPLLAVWVGSQVGDQTTLTMTAAFVVLRVLAVLVAAMALALTWLNNTYDELIGRPRTERRVPWLRSTRAEAEGHWERGRVPCRCGCRLPVLGTRIGHMHQRRRIYRRTRSCSASSAVSSRSTAEHSQRRQLATTRSIVRFQTLHATCP